MRKWIDLRSDTLTIPDRPMLETVLTAPLGDDGRADARGRGEDAAVNEREDLAAALTGKEAAVLFPSGTMANSAPDSKQDRGRCFMRSTGSFRSTDQIQGRRSCCQWA